MHGNDATMNLLEKSIKNRCVSMLEIFLLFFIYKDTTSVDYVERNTYLLAHIRPKIDSSYSNL